MVLYQNKVVGASIPALPGTESGNLSSPDFDTILILDQDEYDALEEKSEGTLYLIRG